MKKETQLTIAAVILVSGIGIWRITSWLQQLVKLPDGTYTTNGDLLKSKATGKPAQTYTDLNNPNYNNIPAWLRAKDAPYYTPSIDPLGFYGMKK